MAYCTYCGTEVADTATACPKCGHPQGGGATGQPAGPRTEGTAIASLILGIAGLTFCPFIPSIIAVILGGQAKAKLAADPTLEGGSLARAGVIMGWVGIGLGLLAIAAFVLVIIFAANNPSDFNFDV